MPTLVVAWIILTENAIALGETLNSHIINSNGTKMIYYFKGTFLSNLLIDITRLHHAYILYSQDDTISHQKLSESTNFPFILKFAGYHFREARRVPFPLVLFVFSFPAMCISNV